MATPSPPGSSATCSEKTGRHRRGDAAEIRYGDGKGNLLDTAHAIATGAVNLNQIKVTYSDGTVVAVNAGTEDFRLDNARPFMIK